MQCHVSMSLLVSPKVSQSRDRTILGDPIALAIYGLAFFAPRRKSFRRQPDSKMVRERRLSSKHFVNDAKICFKVKK